MNLNVSASSSLRLYLIRHGETEWSVSGQYTGREDIPLTAHGKEMAKQLGHSLRNISFTHVFSSPLKRAQQTCELAALNQRAMIEPDLMEWNNGEDTGKTPEDILARRPGWNLFRDGSPGGETGAEISLRADRLIVRLRELQGNVALFSHGHFSRVFAARWLGLTVEHAQHFIFNTASLSILSFEHECLNVPAIELWNSAVPVR